MRLIALESKDIPVALEQRADSFARNTSLSPPNITFMTFEMAENAMRDGLALMNSTE
jgi:hypothetical protein